MNCFRSALIGLTIASSALFSSSADAASAKKYQVTGIVTALTDTVITVQKDDEKFEINRDADVKVDGKIKVGSKVTVFYTMSATSIENKDKK